VLLAAEGETTPEVRNWLLQECWPTEATQPRAVVGEAWAEAAFAALGGRLGAGVVAQRVRRLAFEGEHVVLETGRARGKLRARQSVRADRDAACWVTLAPEAETSDTRSAVHSRLKPFSAEALHEGHVQRWTPRLERFFGRSDIQRLLEEVKTAAGVTRLADA